MGGATSASGIIQSLGAGTVDNCHFSGTVTSTSVYAVGIIGALTGGVSVTNCVNYGTITGTGGSTVAFGVCASGSASISSCVNHGNVTSTNTNAGGICQSSLSITACVNYGTIVSNGGNQANAISGGITAFIPNGGAVSECANFGELNGQRVGGICPQANGTVTISNCMNRANLSAFGLGRVAGILGQVDGTVTINNCYNTGQMFGVATQSAAINRFRFGAGTTTVNNTYFDTTVGYPTSVYGTGQTTSALQTPTTPSGIYAAWNSPPWDFGTSIQYPFLSTTP